MTSQKITNKKMMAMGEFANVVCPQLLRGAEVKL
jgi:hypothetical protein